MSIDFWSMSCAAMVLGIVLAVAAAVLKYIGQSKEPYSGHAEARVVDIVTEPRNGTYSLSQFHNRQAAVFEFFADGKLVKVKDKNEVYPTPYRMNQKIRILYNPDDPQEFCVAEQNRWSRASKIANAAAVCFAVFGCICFLMHAGRVEL